MTPDHPDHTPDDDDQHGVLDATGAIDTTSIGFLGAAPGQVTVSIPGETEHDLEDDDDIVGDEIEYDTGEVVLDRAADEVHDRDDEPFRDGTVVVVIDEPAPEASDPPVSSPDDDEHDGSADQAAVESAPEEDAAGEEAAVEAVGEEAGEEAAPAEAAEAPVMDEQDAPADVVDEPVAPEQSPSAEAEDADAQAEALDVHVLARRWLQGGSTWAVEAEIIEQTGELPVVADAPEPYADEDITDAVEVVDTGEHRAMPGDAETAPDTDTIDDAPTEESAAPTATTDAEESAVNEKIPTTGEQPVAPVAPTTGSISTRREAQAQAPARSVERVAPRADVALTSKRLGEFESGRETADLLTPDRLIDPNHVARSEPEGTWQHFVYRMSGHRINLGDSKRARARKELDRRISAALPGGARFVPVVSRKGGVGKTTVTTLLGMALADARDDRVIAIDANPDRGTLADRIARSSDKTVRDLVKVRGEVVGYNDLSSIVARDETRLDVVASDADPRIAEAFSDEDYDDVASLAAHYYSLVLTDTGTGIVHAVMGATLGRADQLVIVAGLSVDEARLASETITWLETNGYGELARRAVIVLNTARPGQPLVRPEELEGHFRTRVRAVVRMPYDAHIATGSAISFRELSPATRQAARELAAVIVEGLRTSTASAA